MGVVYITRKEHFNAAHKLFRPDWSEQKNDEVFGKCANANWHGHNFDLFVTVKGIPDPETGFVINLKHLSNLLKLEVVDKLDHKNLNLDVDFLFGQMPSIENIVIAIWNQIGGQLYSIKLYETENNFVEYFGKSE